MKSYFGKVGSIYQQGESQTLQFRISSLKDLSIIINHFNQYSLITQKKADFELFKIALDLMNHKEHLTIEGIHKLIAIKASMNLGLSEELKVAFPETIPVSRPIVEDQEIKDPNWLVGFTEAEGCFECVISKSKTKTGFRVQLRFTLTQHSRDQPRPLGPMNG